MCFITIRKANAWTPSYYILTNVFNPPHITVNDVNDYYTITYKFYLRDEFYEMSVDSDLSESNKSMQISSDENDKMSVDNCNDDNDNDNIIVDNNDNNDNEIQERLKNIYYQINSVVNGSFTLNHGDIIEFPSGEMYFYNIPCIRIN